MTIVPKGKTIYIKGRRFIEGDVIPDNLLPEQVTIETTAPKKRVRPRSTRGRKPQREIY